jgi:hypothetical protein
MFPTIASDFDVEWGVACDFFLAKLESQLDRHQRASRL